MSEHTEQTSRDVCETSCTNVANQAAEQKRPSERTVVTRPRIDIRETDTAFHLLADMPGVDENSAEVLVEKNVLTIRGAAEPFSPEGYEQVYAESATRTYERLIRLPEDVDASALEASVKNGVLQLVLPKSAQAQTVRVPIKAG